MLYQPIKIKSMTLEKLDIDVGVLDKELKNSKLEGNRLDIQV